MKLSPGSESRWQDTGPALTLATPPVPWTVIRGDTCPVWRSHPVMNHSIVTDICTFSRHWPVCVYNGLTFTLLMPGSSVRQWVEGDWAWSQVDTGCTPGSDNFCQVVRAAVSHAGNNFRYGRYQDVGKEAAGGWCIHCRLLMSLDIIKYLGHQSDVYWRCVKRKYYTTTLFQTWTYRQYCQR